MKAVYRPGAGALKIALGRACPVLVAALAGWTLAACGGDTSSPTSPADSGGQATLSGRVVGTVAGQPAASARVEVGGTSATTDLSGRFQVSVGGGVLPITVSAGRHVTRRSFVETGAAEALVDIIEEGGLWNLPFYRELCRDGSGGRDLRPLNPWTMEPRFYVDRSPESPQNRPIPDTAVETVVEAIRTVLALLTRGRLRGDRIEIGIEPPADLTEGTVVIRWDPVEVSQVAGPAAAFTRGVGGNASVVVIRTIEDTESIFHELGHVLGLYHPLSGFRPSLMIGSGTRERPYYTDWDVVHANILYARPAGNTDIDNDPSGFVLNRSTTLAVGSPTLVACTRELAGVGAKGVAARR